MPGDHPYRQLPVPKDAPFELRPSPGKGWGVFATRQIRREEVLLREKPLFVIGKPAGEVTEMDVVNSIAGLAVEGQ
ncbi:hypothetical protein FQN57_006967 [Myotisia sp. PD_48]|nr:hypothetical protein FQN57_006967 [Myotisia sp. PD_48]